MANGMSHSDETEPLLHLDDNEGDGIGGHIVPSETWRAIYASHFLRSWGERAWEFAVGLILLSLKPDTLWLVAAYGLVENLAVILLGPCVGSALDRQKSQLRGALWSFNVQNFMNILSAAIAFVTLSLPKEFNGTMRKDALIAGMVAASCAARLASTAASLSIERKWVKLLCKSQDDQRMAVINSAMRRIDLLCLLAAPIASGFCMTYLSLRAATVALAAWNAITWAPSILLLCHAGKSLPLSRVCSHGSSLLLPPVVEEEISSSDAPDDGGIGVPAPALVPVEDCDSLADTRGCMFWRLCCYGPARGICKGFGLVRIYWQQPVAFPAFALAMLYFSVMSLGLIMTSYLKWKGISEAELSIFRGCGATASVFATITFPPLNKRVGARASGILGGGSQLLCLSAATFLLFLASSNRTGSPAWMLAEPQEVLLYSMLVCLMLSRWGLWTFDLAVTQQIQESVDESTLGVFNGIQGSLQSFFELAMSCLTLAVPSPQDFAWLAAASTFTVLLSFVVYSSHLAVAQCRISSA